MLPQRRVTIIGIAGDSGAGKSTYVEHLRTLLGEDRVTVMTGDDYHSLDRVERSKLGVTALDPWKANNLGLLVDHVWSLKQGRSIIKPIYDHSTGTFAEPEEIRPKDVVLIEGLHILYLEKLREAIDLKIYFDTDIPLRVRWKVRRDAGVRGYTETEVLQEIERRKPDVERFIEPQKAWADLVIHYLPDDDREPTELIPEPIRVRVAERMKGGKRRLVKWLALASRLGLIDANHYHDQIAGEEMEIASFAGSTDLSSMHSLLEMISDNHYLADQMDALHYDPVCVSRLLVANMISELAYNARQSTQSAKSV
jgi:phosphoribulokinase